MNEIYWVSPPPTGTIGPNKIPIMRIRGIPLNSIDFHFEKYPTESSEDGVIRQIISPDLKNMLMQGASVSAPLGSGQYLNVVHQKIEEPPEVKNMDLQQYLRWKKQQRARPDMVGAAAAAPKKEAIKITIDSGPKHMELPDIWFKMARFTVYDAKSRKSWTTKEHDSIKPDPGLKQLVAEPFRPHDVPTVEPERPTPRPEPLPLRVGSFPEE